MCFSPLHGTNETSSASAAGFVDLPCMIQSPRACGAHCVCGPAFMALKPTSAVSFASANWKQSCGVFCDPPCPPPNIISQSTGSVKVVPDVSCVICKDLLEAHPARMPCTTLRQKNRRLRMAPRAGKIQGHVRNIRGIARWSQPSRPATISWEVEPVGRPPYEMGWADAGCTMACLTANTRA